MKIKDSTRLWYGKYAYKAVFSAKLGGKIKAWLTARDCDYLARRYLASRSLMIFLTKKEDIDDLVMAFASEVLEQHRPASVDIESFMKSHTHVEIRRQLLYKKFRHKIYFRYEWINRGSPALEEFISQHLSNREDYLPSVDWSVNLQSYQPTLYLAHDSDLMMVKMSVDVSSIVKITTIKLHNEI